MSPPNRERPGRNRDDLDSQAGTTTEIIVPTIFDETATSPNVSRDTIDVHLIDPDPDQPRQRFDPAALEELATSIRNNGLAVPILLRPAGDRYVIVHGERRWRATKQLGHTSIAAEVRDLDPEEARWLQLVENITRDDLGPLEEARAYRAALQGDLTQQQLADRIGKTRTYIAQKLRLLKLTAPLTLLLDEGALTEGHTRELLRIKGMYTDRHVIGYAINLAATKSMFANLSLDSGGPGAAFETLVRCRPLDWPPGYPGLPMGEAVLERATEALWIEMAETGSKYPQWSLPAFYYAVMTAWGGVSVADLSKIIDNWIEQIRSAVIMVDHFLPPERPTDKTSSRHAEWEAYRSDLRHAGLLDDHEHLNDWDVLWPLIDRGPLLPSNCVGTGPYRDSYAEAVAREAELPDAASKLTPAQAEELTSRVRARMTEIQQLVDDGHGDAVAAVLGTTDVREHVLNMAAGLTGGDRG